MQQLKFIRIFQPLPKWDKKVKYQLIMESNINNEMAILV